MNQSTLYTGLKLLAVVMLTELLIMSAFDLLGVDSSLWWVNIGDVVLLGIITAFVVHLWIIQPLTQAREQDALFRSVAENSHAGLVITDPNQDNAIIYTNAAFSTITGYSMAEAKGRHPEFLSQGLPHQADQDKISSALQAAEPVDALLKNKRKDGSFFWNDLHLSPINLDGSKPHYWLGLLHDVTETKELNLQVEHLVNAVEQATDMICIFDTQGNINFANQAFAHHTGVEKAQLIGQSVWQYWCDETWTAPLVQDALRHHGQWSGHNQWCRHDQTRYEAMTNITIVDGDDQQGMHIAVIRDMTEEIETSNQLAHAQKMEAVGTLAGGIAHDFNNMLAAMMGNLYLLKKKMSEDNSAVNRIETIEQQGHRGADLIRQMLIFARKEVVEKQDFDLQLLAKETIKLLHTSTPENIRLNTTVDPASLMIHGDPSLLQSGLFNLVNNARHTIEDEIAKTPGHDGVIELSFCAESIDAIPTKISNKITQKNSKTVYQCVHITVSDNGSGMDQVTLKHIFEPYFTTKKPGKGTGLGLPMVMGCVEMHAGWIDVSSSIGLGTSIDIYLPLITAVTTTIQHDKAIQPGQGELILLADDDQTLRESMCEILEDAGYRVLTAEDGEQAIQQYMQHQQDIRLVIMDCVMPKLGGVEAAQAISQYCDDNMEIALMTGYSQNATLMTAWDSAREQPLTLSKPWQIEQLNTVLQSIHRHQQDAI